MSRFFICSSSPFQSKLNFLISISSSFTFIIFEVSKELLNNSILKIISLIIFIFLLVHFFDAEIFSFKNKSSLSGYSMIEAVNSYNGNLLNLEKGFINTGHHKTTSLISWIYWIKFFIQY